VVSTTLKDPQVADTKTVGPDGVQIQIYQRAE
jgi:hypothetical protein